MGIVKVVGIIALVVFLVAYIGDKVMEWISTSSVCDKICQILEYVECGAMTIALVCGIIHLFA